MMTPEQFSRSWGVGLIRTEPVALAGVNIPDNAKRFLMEAGLPSEADYDISFDRPEDELPTLPEAFPNGYDFPAAYQQFRPIGVDGATLLCLQEETGYIYSIDIDGQGIPIRFVNSGVTELAECLLVNRVVPQDAEGNGKDLEHREDADESTHGLVGTLAQKMHEIDPSAMNNAENYWPQFFRAALL